ncbi:restriction endonuclease subunit S [Vibrio albus]|uniref:Restriction endonuclease subunit S n=1 Tax=Vibrio albus TaxID=2200953 RepID=A0A2U3BBQ8_9VIBR|nr:restriction endonuclease subunit S [Vibrio albus]PWI34231.1 restriction endonuclease subunit S [Vibrio albus]
MSVENLITQHIDIWTSAVQTKSTAGRGTSSKLDLYGIKKLRELILELAVRGKLVPQDPNDEPASVLLERIEKEKTQLVKEKKIKKPKKLEYISENEMFFELPLGWKWVRLNDLGEWGSGSTPKRSISEYYGGEIPWFKSGELNQDYISESEEYITELALKETSVRYNNIGDVLVAMYGATIGKTSILSVRATTNQAVCACTPFTGLVNTYLLLLLKAYKSRLVGMGAGGAQPNISREKIINTVTALPPEKEQHRIVAKVDELMKLCDQLEQQTEASIAAHQVLVETLLATLTNSKNAEELMENWQRISAHFDTLFTTEDSIDQLKQTILQLAVMGKLVAQNPADEPASELLKRIAKEKAQLVKDKKIKKQKALPPIADDEKPFELPNGWEWCRVQDVAMFTTSGSRDWARYYSETGALFVTMGNLSRGSYDLRLDNLRYVHPPEGGEGSRTKLEANDLLISITGDVGNLGLIPENFGEAYINQHTCLLRFMPECKDRYFPEFMRSPWAKFQFDAPQRGIKNSFRLSDVGDMFLPLPPKQERFRIASKIDELLRVCDLLKFSFSKSQATQLVFTDAIVEQVI